MHVNVLRHEVLHDISVLRTTPPARVAPLLFAMAQALRRDGIPIERHVGHRLVTASFGAPSHRVVGVRLENQLSEAECARCDQDFFGSLEMSLSLRCTLHDHLRIYSRLI